MTKDCEIQTLSVFCSPSIVWSLTLIFSPLREDTLYWLQEDSRLRAPVSKGMKTSFKILRAFSLTYWRQHTQFYRKNWKYIQFSSMKFCEELIIFFWLHLNYSKTVRLKLVAPVRLNILWERGICWERFQEIYMNGFREKNFGNKVRLFPEKNFEQKIWNRNRKNCLSFQVLLSKEASVRLRYARLKIQRILKIKNPTCGFGTHSATGIQYAQNVFFY